MNRFTNLFIFGSLLWAANLFAASAPAVGDSTFGLVPVQYIDEAGNLHDTLKGQPLVANGCYVSIEISAARIFAHTPTWKAIWNTNSLAYATVRLTGHAGSISVAETRTSMAVRVKKGDTVKDLGFSGPLLDAVPWSFQNLNLHLEMDSSEDSTIANVIGGLSEVSSKLPALTLSSAVTAGESIATIFDKLLFAQGRSDARLHGDFGFVTKGSDSRREGYYVIFGADSAASYNKYLLSARTPAGPQLEWNGRQLLFGTTPVEDVSFFVIKIHQQARLWDDSDLAEVGNNKPWSQELDSILLDIASFPAADSSAQEATKADTDFPKTCAAEKLHIDDDPDVLESEKLAIQGNLKKACLGRFDSAFSQSTQQAVTQDTSAPPPTSGNAKTTRPILEKDSLLGGDSKDVVTNYYLEPTVRSQRQTAAELREQHSKAVILDAVNDLTNL
jgi:hypothetical protein